MIQVRKTVRAAACLLLIAVAGCSHTDGPANPSLTSTTLRVGFGQVPTAEAQNGMLQTASGVTLEGLVRFDYGGRPLPWLAKGWSVSSDNLIWHISLRDGVTFHDGKPVTAAAVEQTLKAQLPSRLGPAFQDVVSIQATSDTDVEIRLREPSAFLLESLDLPISEPGSPTVGTGAFYLSQTEDGQVELRANESYYGGKPLIDRIEMKPYESMRAAWADLLRSKIDMLFEVGLEAFDSLEPSTAVQIIRTKRPYLHMLLLNLERPALKDPRLRRVLARSVDRERLVKEGLEGHGTPADGPVWPDHRAYNPSVGRLTYAPTAIGKPDAPLVIHCLFGADASRERLALALQQQLEPLGIDLQLDALSPSEVVSRMNSGDFDAILSDFVQGPNLVRPYWFWHTGGPFNFGHYSNPAVDRALDSIRHSTNDDEYKAGVTAFQRAIADDPPAIFLAWSERIRAVSKRFELPETGGEVWGPYLRLWRPAPDQDVAQTSH
jgi:peptide/nickel transport system substrate-binding protein